MSETREITLVAALTFAEPVAGTVLEALAAVMAATRREPGCVQYNAHVHAGDPRRVLFYERWRDRAALDAHNASAHLAAFRATVAPLLACAPDLGFWKRLG